MYEDYPNAASDVVDFFHSLFYWNEWKENPGDDDTPKRRTERIAIAKMMSLIQTGQLRSTFDDATLIQLHSAQVENWPADIGDGMPEVATMSELISIALNREIEKRPDGGMRWEYQKFLRMLGGIEQVALAAERKGGVVGKKAKEKVGKQIIKMITTPDISCKIRESGSVVEYILENSNTDETQKVELVHEIFDEIISDKVPLMQFRENNRKRMGKTGKTIHNPVPGTLYLLGGREIIMIESRAPSQTRAIENKLKGIVTDLSPRDGLQMLERANELLHFNTSHKPYFFSLEGTFMEREDGLVLPTQEAYYIDCLNTVLKSREVIDQYVEVTDQPLYIMIDEITHKLNRKDEVLDFLCTSLHCSMNLLPTLMTATSKRYPVSIDLTNLWPKRDMTTLFYLNEHSIFGLAIRI